MCRRSEFCCSVVQLYDGKNLINEDVGILRSKIDLSEENIGKSCFIFVINTFVGILGQLQILTFYKKKDLADIVFF